MVFMLLNFVFGYWVRKIFIVDNINNYSIFYKIMIDDEQKKI